jgi:nucleoside-diphosphate-sugar epimerase
MKVVLVTGASGFVGTHVVKYCREHGLKVIAVLHDEVVWSKWLQESLADTVRVKGDVRDTQFMMRVLNQYGVTDVIHLAAQSIVKRAYKDPLNTFAINVMGTVSVLEAVRQLQTSKVLIQSTDKVYGDNLQAIVGSKLVPTEPYGTSKVCVDIIAQTYRQTYGMPIVVTRPCNIYGYDSCNDRIIPNTIKKCIKGEKPFVFKDEASTRQYVFVDDVCEVFRDLLELADCAPIVNIASNTILSQEDVVFEILKSFPKLSPEYIEKPFLKEIHSQCMNEFVKAKKPMCFSEGIKKTIDQFIKYGW